MAFIDAHRGELGIEPICRELAVAPSSWHEHAVRLADPGRRSVRARRDDEIMEQISRVHEASFGLYCTPNPVYRAGQCRVLPGRWPFDRRCRDHLRPCWRLHGLRLVVYTGARLREITDLRWEWIEGWWVRLPDSKTGPKTIWLNREARDILASIPQHHGHSLVFPNTRGNRPIDLQQWWQKFRRRCALPDVRIHDLRHSFASVAIREGVPLATIGVLLGHKLPETTARYAHLADDTIAAAASRVSGNLANALGLVA